MPDHSGILNLMQGGSPYPASPLLRTGLSLLSAGYLTGIFARNSLYNTGLSKIYRLPWPVVSIGNITTGGTGKTPFVLLAANHLLTLGRTPCVLTRGYQPHPTPAPGFSDEATLLQQSLAGCGHVQINPNRHAGALEARKAHPDIDAFILDDGFQHRKLHRNLDIVLIDASMHPGLWHALPRGLMREPPSALARASMVIITRANQVSPRFPQGLRQLDTWVQKHHGKPPAAHAIHAWQGYLDAHDNTLPPDALQSHNHILALCALGNPDAFFAMAKTNAAPTAQVQTITLPDHHTFDSYQSLKLKVLDPAKSQNACLLTTEKDWVKLKPLIPPDAWDSLPPILRPKLTLQFLHGPDPLPAALKSIL